MSGSFKVLALGGDHIGPEVVAAGLQVLRQTADQFGVPVEVEEDLLGGASWDLHGTFCTDAVVAKARAADAILVGAVGGPEWDSIRIDGPITETDGLTRLRIELDVYNALRPARAWPALLHRTPYRWEVVEGVDLLVVRENSGGIYYGEPRGREMLSDGQVRAYEISEYRTSEVERIARCAFEAARGRRGHVTSLDKSNVMESGKLWRETVERIGRDEYPDVELHHLLMDYALFAVARAPRNFDVLLGDNLFGDLISDLIAVVSGSLGMLPSATLPSAARAGGPVKGGLYEPTHGSAPDISGQGIANPIGAILSVAMMFEYGFGCPAAARAIEGSVDSVLNAGLAPPDLGGTADTGTVTQAVLDSLGSRAS
ncbi:3-isopropylmalate dehydrogenase [Tropicibacter sp. R16_0]|uniref:3-isopropylmalate dehydrogenase n=1 Tax=Tropicibacter sp. R16_0 TaxID=2821102 RepID=UPI001ADACFF6|nr:3-isopropylmalate dehydrogenase [Tropicibacter sp. R16_0]MBO9452233.1 3-isopropylmalate dehydrogenase [Tropicibacter sp. R16_0]